MIVETYIGEKFVRERELSLEDFKNKLESFVFKNEFTKAKIVTVSPVKKGVSLTFTNEVDMHNFELKYFGEVLIVEFEEFKNVFTLNNSANVCLDTSNKSLRLEDFCTSIYFS